MSFLAGLPRVWVSIHVPGTRVEPVLATYFAYPSDRLPALPPDVLGLAWLRDAGRHPEDDMAHGCEWAVLDPSPRAVAELLGSAQALPPDFARFLGGGGLRDRLRSATGSYFDDLGHFAVEVEGGRLLHLVSDSQWVFHWLLYVGDDGASAVVGARVPAGFKLDADEADFWQTEEWRYVRVAESFAEFAWRWWMDNEIFYRVKVEQSEVSADQRRYVAAYGLGAAS